MDNDLSHQSPQPSNEPELLNAPLLSEVRPHAPATLFIERRDGARIVVDLELAIAAHGSEFASLQDQHEFDKATVAPDGTAVMWPSVGLTMTSKLLHSIAAKQFHDREKGEAASPSID